MDVKDAVLQRRSVRSYKNKDVKLEVLGEILDIARYAASSGNLQNWKFIIVTDDKVKEEIATVCLEQMWMTEAPAYIVICNQFKKVTETFGKLGKMYSIQNCANVATTIMLLAKEYGLDTCWIGGFNNDSIQRILKIPEDVDPEIILTIGYGNDVKVSEPVREELKTLVFFEKWGKKEAKIKGGFFNKLKKILKK